MEELLRYYGFNAVIGLHKRLMGLTKLLAYPKAGDQERPDLEERVRRQLDLVMGAYEEGKSWAENYEDMEDLWASVGLKLFRFKELAIPDLDAIVGSKSPIALTDGLNGAKDELVQFLRAKLNRFSRLEKRTRLFNGILNLYAGGVSDKRFEMAMTAIEQESLTVNDKLEKLDEAMPIPPTASAAKLGALLGCTDTAVKRSAWWEDHRKGRHQEAPGQREAQHKKRAKLSDPPSE